MSFVPDTSPPITTQDEGDRTRVRFVETELTAFNVQPIGDALDRLVPRCRRRTLVIDLDGVRYLPSAGIAILIQVQKKLGAVKGRLVLANATEPVAAMFRLTGLDKVLYFESDGSTD